MRNVRDSLRRERLGVAHAAENYYHNFLPWSLAAGASLASKALLEDALREK
jgi:hypothetical protein